MLNALRKTAKRLFSGRKPATEDAAIWRERFAKMRASYDAARTSDEFKNYWANADSYDADSAHSREVRHKLIARSRYELGNNGFADGIAQTYATDLVGIGPSLRMQSGSEGFNRMVEAAWESWAKAVQLRRRLWCMAHAKHSDGEALAVLRRNPKLRHPVTLDFRLYEAEQFQTPLLPWQDGYIDGIKFDDFGNPEWYDLMNKHPGSALGTLDLTPERITADRVLHWFKLRRPGQHRAVPEMTSTLNVGAAARRWREATLSAAERAALLTLMMKTQMTPETLEVDSVAPFSTMDIEKGLMSFLPAGWDPFQADGKFPTANHEAFNRTLISEQARPKSMPYNRAAADSSGHNFASGKLDFMPYFSALHVDRADANDLVLDPLFAAWFEQAAVRFGWLGGDPMAISDRAKAHSWDWPALKNADEKADATASATKLTSGQMFLHQLFNLSGQDLEDEIATAATTFGVDEQVIRQRLLDLTLPPAQQQQATAEPSEIEALLRQRFGIPKVNGNGAHHA